MNALAAGIALLTIALILFLSVVIGLIQSSRLNIFIIVIMGGAIWYGTYLVISST